MRSNNRTSRSTNQIIIDFYSGINPSSAQALKNKWDVQHPDNPCTMITREDLRAILNGHKIFQLHDEGKTKIYIILHSAPGKEYFSYKYNTSMGIKKELIKYDKLAEVLSQLIGNHQVVVNLICCSAARGTEKNPTDNPEKSIAVKLHKQLTKLQKRDIPVVARTQILAVDATNDKNYYGKKFTIDLNLSHQEAIHHMQKNSSLHHKQPSSKVIIKLDNDNKQVIADAYSASWKEKVLESLVILRDHTEVSQKKVFLQKWLDSFENEIPENILQIMQSEIENPNSILKENSNLILKLFDYTTDSYRNIEDLIKEGSRIIYHEYPTKNI
jgi:hypothetical protein